MKIDLTYTNKAGISLQDIIDILSDSDGRDFYSKRDIQDGLHTETSIDVLLKKLEDSSVIEKYREGNKLLYTVSSMNRSVETPTVEVHQPEINDATPTIDDSPIKTTTTSRSRKTKTVDPVIEVHQPVIIDVTPTMDDIGVESDEAILELQQSEIIDDTPVIDDYAIIKKTRKTKVIENPISVEETQQEIQESDAIAEVVVEESVIVERKGIRRQRPVVEEVAVGEPVSIVEEPAIIERKGIRRQRPVVEEVAVAEETIKKTTVEVIPVPSMKKVPPKSIVEPLFLTTATEEVTTKNNRLAPKLTKANVKGAVPAKVKSINEQTHNVTKHHQITALIDMEDLKDMQHPRMASKEVSQVDLDILKKEMESRLGKEITTILHKRNSNSNNATRNKKSSKEIYEKQQQELALSPSYNDENPYRFILNFFTSVLNKERSTPYFRRRDEYVVRSLYNKFKVLCEMVDDYNITPQNLPFYRVITINEEDWTVKIYHIDMNRIIRGIYTVFKLKKSDTKFIKFKGQ